jgi:hypothetical protein
MEGRHTEVFCLVFIDKLTNITEIHIQLRRERFHFRSILKQNYIYICIILQHYSKTISNAFKIGQNF